MPNFDLKARFEANVSLPKWCSFVINLTAFLLLRVYSILRPAFEYLQGLDYLSAWSMVQCAKEALKKIQFDEVHEKTSCFISKIKDKVDTLGVTLENTPGEKRVSRKKLIPGGQRFCITGCRIYRIHIFQQLSINHVYIYSLLIAGRYLSITELNYYITSPFISIIYFFQTSIISLLCYMPLW